MSIHIKAANDWPTISAKHNYLALICFSWVASLQNKDHRQCDDVFINVLVKICEIQIGNCRHLEAYNKTFGTRKDALKQHRGMFMTLETLWDSMRNTNNDTASRKPDVTKISDQTIFVGLLYKAFKVALLRLFLKGLNKTRYKGL